MLAGEEAAADLKKEKDDKDTVQGNLAFKPSGVVCVNRKMVSQNVV